MTAGDIVKETGLIIEEFTVKANEDVEKGEVVYNDGNGILAASSTAKGPFYVALEDHDYSAKTTHKVRCVVRGQVKAQKKSGAAIKKGQFTEISTTDGEVTVFDYTTPGNWYDVVGEAMEDVADTATEVTTLVGKQ